MRNKRMLSNDIIGSDLFLEMPPTSQVLYFYLCMHADDDGFISSPKKIMRMINASEDDLKILMAKNFIIAFDSGVCVVTHWKIHNYVPNDRYKQTIYVNEKASLALNENGTYTQVRTDCIQSVSSLDAVCQPNGHKVDTQYNIRKDNIREDNIIYTASDEAEKTNEAKKANATEEKQADCKKSERFLQKPKKADNDNDNDNDSDNDNNKKEMYREKSSESCRTQDTHKFQKPTLEEIREYCSERNNSINPERFYDYYTSNGWMIGRTKMKDWRAAVRTWEQNDKKNYNKDGPGNIGNESQQTGGIDWNHLPGVTILT